MVHEPRMDARLARRLIQKKQQLDVYRPMESFTVQRLHQDLRLLVTYHSNAIEGNTLSLHETQMVLEYGITVDGHPLREYLEATNHAEAFDTFGKPRRTGRGTDPRSLPGSLRGKHGASLAIA
jgi:Fic family protein